MGGVIEDRLKDPNPSSQTSFNWAFKVDGDLVPSLHLVIEMMYECIPQD